ncbi:restriction endonuclease subunit S [Bacillus sp. FSL W8-0116]|uniref:restriction endonuclease subunit S n=1 Tax=Bacillus sp. FSL W8-0116 TaxID=2978206 RepID=UPI0030F87B9D
MFNSTYIEDITEKIFSGGTPSTKKNEYWNGEFPWLSSGETRNDFIYSTEKSITEEGIKNSSTKLAKKNDIVIASAGQGNTRGQVAFCKINTYINQSVIAVRTNETYLDPLFLFYNFKGRYRELRKISDGHSIRGSLTTKILKRLKIKVPAIKEQKKISSLLYSLDQRIETNNRINEKLEEMAQALFKHWFVDFEFPNENGEPYKSSGGEMVESELGMIPKGWEVGTIKDIGEVVGGGTPSKKKNDYYTSNGIPWITPKDLSGFNKRYIKKGSIDITHKGYKNSSAKMLPKGSVLFSSRAPIGYIAIASNEVTTNQGFKSVVPFENFGTEFVFQTLKNNIETIKNRASGSTFKEISGGELKKIEVILPPQNVVDKFNQRTKKIGELIATYEEQNERLEKLRDTLLPKLMSGEIRVPLDDEVLSGQS